MDIVLYVALFSSLFTGTDGLYCLHCIDIAEARNCDNVVECSASEVCYSTQFITSTGRIYRKMGCRKATTCTHGVFVGKRNSGRRNEPLLSGYLRHFPSSTYSKRAKDSVICDECCASDVCQTKLCSERNDIHNGRVCFNCGAQSPDVQCTKIQRCSTSQNCFNSTQNTGVLNSGCIFSNTCTNNMHSLSRNTTWTCCDSDLCNKNYISHPASTTRGPCVDLTPEDTCRLASTIVCQDLVHATNANCAHYCGYC